jgi:mannose/cellobiose epimerase-like protein (N-acyl-D-glucosamine 2-epimerase family)
MADIDMTAEATGPEYAARDTYDHAFVLLALSMIHRLSHDAQVRDEIKSLLNYLDADLQFPNGKRSGFLALRAQQHAFYRY